MFFCKILKRKVEQWAFRFCIFFAVAYGQELDSVNQIQVQGGMEYFDIVSQETANSSSEFFFRRSFLQTSYSYALDTFTVGIHSQRLYGQYTNSSSLWTFSLNHDFNYLRGSWSSAWSFVGYTAVVWIPQVNNIRPAFSASVRLQPFGERFTGEFGYASGLERVASTISFLDFVVPLGEDIADDRRYFSIALLPADNLRLSFSANEQRSGSHNEKKEFSSEYSGTSFGREVAFDYRPAVEWGVTGLLSIREQRPTIRLMKYDLMFAEFPLGMFSHYHASIGMSATFFSRRYFFSAERDEVKITENGIIQSWPFTSLAASVIVNRFLFDLQGSLVQHHVSVRTSFRFNNMSVTPLISYHQIVPDYTLKHWQPQYFVFGIKNLTIDRSTIAETHLAKAEITVEYGVWNGKATLRLEQYAPLYIRYNSSPSLSDDGTRQLYSEKKNKIDGGRYIGLTFSY